MRLWSRVPKRPYLGLGSSEKLENEISRKLQNLTKLNPLTRIGKSQNCAELESSVHCPLQQRFFCIRPQKLLKSRH